MAQLHLKHPELSRSRSYACFTINRNHTYNALMQDDFIAEYNRRAGRECCVKCAQKLVDKGLLTLIVGHQVSNNKVIQLLIEGTQILHDEYIEKTKNYANEMYQWAKERSTWTSERWYQEFGVETIKQGNSIVPDHNVKENRYRVSSLYKTRNNVYAILKFTEDIYVAKEIKRAEDHYTNSIFKLADRIKQKALNVDRLTVKSGRVGVNIETTITDGIINVRAWTIIAHGPIKRPHYRYLVK